MQERGRWIMGKVIKIKCEYDKLILLEDLFSIQENLKVKHDIKRLKESIVNNGFIFPIYVWLDFSDNRYKLIDGYHRKLACQELVKEGNAIFSLPAILIECKTHKEAKEYVLWATARYSGTTKDKFKDFTEEAGLDMAELSDELSHKDFSFLNDLLIEPEDLEEVKPKETIKEVGSRKPKISIDDIEYTIFQIVFESKEQLAKFWTLMSRIKSYEYKLEDYKDILFAILKKECEV